MEIQIQGIGGIDSSTVTLTDGVNLLEGRNATNRSSFLQGLMAAIGSTDVSLKADRDEGYVELTIDGTEYTRTLERTGDGLSFGGDPYLSDSMEADLFAFLLETNDVRQAVKANRELRDIIMRPVDTVEIETQIRTLQTERREIDDQIQALETERERLPRLEEKRTEIREQLAATRTEVAEARADLEAADADVADQQEEKERLEETLDELGSARSELDSIEYRLETEREALASAEEELDATQQRQPETAETVSERLATLEDEIERRREEKRTCEARISKLNRMVQFNEAMLDGDSELRELFEGDAGAVTDELLADDSATCWTCGSEVDVAEIDSMLDRLRELSRTQRKQRSEIEATLDELTEERETLEAERTKREAVAEQIETLEADIERRREAIESLETERSECRERIEALEAEAAALEDVDESRVLELHKTVNEKEVEVEQLEAELADLTGRIEDLEAKADEIGELEREREQITEQLTELRTRIERLESEAVEAFNEHMAALVDLLEYENLARVWLERKSTPASTGDGTDSTFVLHIVRTTEDGATYEDALEHLSESEREVIGIVFALAGYLVHEVYETQPFLLLDSLEAIDAERIALLIDYLDDYAPTIVAALLEEDSRLLDDSYPRIRDI